MPPFGPVSRKNLIRYFRAIGFDGPYSGGKHSFLTKGDLAVTIPNPHNGDIGRELSARVLRQAGITREEWEQLDR
jgi:predicted RNA binding protein YcfA (HicA-like mRNA interferase family)